MSAKEKEEAEIGAPARGVPVLFLRKSYSGLLFRYCTFHADSTILRDGSPEKNGNTAALAGELLYEGTAMNRNEAKKLAEKI